MAGMRLDGDATTVIASSSPASQSCLWGVGLIQAASSSSSSRDRSSPLSLARIAAARGGEREEVGVERRRREESRRRQQEQQQQQEEEEEEERERRAAAQQRKRQGKKLQNSRDVRTQIAPAVMAVASPPPRSFTVGYALTSKKIKSFIQPKLESHARYRRILHSKTTRTLSLVPCVLRLSDVYLKNNCFPCKMRNEGLFVLRSTLTHKCFLCVCSCMGQYQGDKACGNRSQ